MTTHMIKGSGQASRSALAAAAFCALVACALAVLLAAPVSQAFAREISAPTRPDGSTMTVSDDITRIHVDKVDARTHDVVIGAKMQIIVRDTGEVVDEWVTDGTTHMFEKGLDVNVDYILREAEAPDGYAKAGDTVFQANEIEGTGITLITKSDSIELTDAYKVTVYEPHDEIVKVEERVEYTTREIPRTGDSIPFGMIVGIGVVAVAVIVIAVIARRKMKGE